MLQIPKRLTVFVDFNFLKHSRHIHGNKLLILLSQTMYPSVQATIWGNVGKVTDLLDTVLDCFIKVLLQSCVSNRSSFSSYNLSLPHLSQGRISRRVLIAGLRNIKQLGVLLPLLDGMLVFAGFIIACSRISDSLEKSEQKKSRYSSCHSPILCACLHYLNVWYKLQLLSHLVRTLGSRSQ